LNRKFKQRFGTAFVPALLVSTFCACSNAAADQHAEGAREYAKNCAVCHGENGHGDGPLHDKLTRRPSDLTALSRNNGGSFPETLVYQVIDGRRMVPYHGSRDMPVWGLRFRFEGDSEERAETRINRLIRFLEDIQKNGTDD
jgi:mono/diheme cytochrome c family protein